MNKTKPRTDDDLAETAAGWVARMQSSDATEEQRQNFERWLGASPSHQAAFDEMAALWQDLKGLGEDDIAPKPGTFPSWAITANMAALCLVAALAATLYNMGLTDRWRSDFYTGIGEVRSITLEDGTRIDLNTDSAIALHYTPKERRIELLRGEAFFDVAKNPQRPFIVEDTSLTAKALGTQYAVRAPANHLPAQVQVEEGHVEVLSKSARAVLGAGEVATLDDGDGLSISRSDVASETAWRSGKLVFSGRPLGEVLATLERYRHGRILLLDSRTASLEVSGIFDLDDTDQALRILESSLPLSVTHVTRMLVVVRSR